jgi:hypothetical protein
MTIQRFWPESSEERLIRFADECQNLTVAETERQILEEIDPALTVIIEKNPQVQECRSHSPAVKCLTIARMLLFRKEMTDQQFIWLMKAIVNCGSHVLTEEDRQRLEISIVCRTCGIGYVRGNISQSKLHAIMTSPKTVATLRSKEFWDF